MLAHLQSVYPQEGCGLLAGKGIHATHLYAIENQRQSQVVYEMEPHQHLRAMMDIEAQGDEVLAAYHSHPHSPPLPSATDIAQAYYPELVYVIVSLQQRSQPVVRAFRIVDGQVTEISLQIAHD